jgi:hypothetical protein
MKNETASRGAVKNLLLTDPCYPPPLCSQVISHLMCSVCSLFLARNFGSVPKIGCWLAFVAHRLWSGSVIFLYQWQPTWRVAALAVVPNWVGLQRVSVIAAPSTATYTGCPGGFRLSVHQNFHAVVAAAIMKILCLPPLWLKTETLWSRYVVFPERWRLTK